LRFSVVINTLNRANSLRATLDALRYQHHDDFEVIVVNGPSTDGTESLLAEYAGRIKHLRCDVANLSMSRNIGIRAAAGDAVAFIDDDAIPEYHWLTDLERGFVDDEHAGVGGIVYDHTGMSLQFEFALSDRYGDTQACAALPDARTACAPGSWWFPSLLGTNSAFRRTSLAEIGLFDETYEYYLDETDVIVRLIDAGYVVSGYDGAPVHHHFLPSHIRNSTRTVTHWYPVIKNRTYFAMRHALAHRTMRDVIRSAVDAAQQRLDECSWAESNGLVPHGSVDRAQEACDRGIVDGIRLASERGTRPLPHQRLDPPAFLGFPTLGMQPGRRVALVTSSFPPRPMNGISRFMSELAPALAAVGHDVRVMTRAEGHPHVSWADGVWIHHLADDHRGSLPGAMEHVDRFVSAVDAEFARLGDRVPVDIAYGGAWDVETLGLARSRRLPVVVMLATPAKVAAREGRWLEQEHLVEPLGHLFELEAELFRSADAVHGISEAIAKTISEEYRSTDGQPPFDRDRLEVFPLGMVDRATATRRPDTRDRQITVLFVGRLELRKGIDVFLAAAERLLTERPDTAVLIAGADTRPEGTSTEAEWRANVSDSISKQVEFLGDVDDSRLHELYAAADVVVLPSRYESFGLVVVEAMMHAAAVISSDVGGIAEVGRSGVDCVLTPPGDAEALAAAMIDLVDRPDRRDELGARARERFDSTFHIDRCARRVSDLLDRTQRRFREDGSRR
jgi:glycogen(starch) synthase